MDWFLYFFFSSPRAQGAWLSVALPLCPQPWPPLIFPPVPHENLLLVVPGILSAVEFSTLFCQQGLCPLLTTPFDPPGLLNSCPGDQLRFSTRMVSLLFLESTICCRFGPASRFHVSLRPEEISGLLTSPLPSMWRRPSINLDAASPGVPL